MEPDWYLKLPAYGLMLPGLTGPVLCGHDEDQFIPLWTDRPGLETFLARSAADGFGPDQVDVIELASVEGLITFLGTPLKRTGRPVAKILIDPIDTAPRGMTLLDTAKVLKSLRANLK